ncbi:MAG: hypothetical protein ACPGR2_13675 [Psychrobium sp.]
MSEVKELQVSKNLLITIYSDNYKVVEYNNMTFEFDHVSLRTFKYYEEDNYTFKCLVFYADVEHVFENFYKICELEIKSKKQLKDIMNFMQIHDFEEFESNYVYSDKGE